MCGGNSTVGSNPTGTATENPRSRGGFLVSGSARGASLVQILLGTSRAAEPLARAHARMNFVRAPV